MMSSEKRPPLVAGWPVIGNVLDIAADPIQFWVNAAKKYGPVYRVRYPTAPAEMTVLAGIEANRLASRETQLFSNREFFHRFIEETGTDNYLSVTDGEKHTYFRKMIKPAFSREVLAPVVPDLLQMVDREVSSWKEGEIVSPMDRLQRVVVDGVSYAASGNPMKDGEYQQLCRFSRLFVGSSAGGWPSFLLKMPFYKTLKHKVHEFLKNVLADHYKRQAGTERRADMIDMILKASYRDGRPLNETDLLANAHLPYTNSVIYTGRVTAFLLYELLNRPDIVKRLVEEIDGVYSGGMPTMRELRDMVLLRNCVKEIFRRRPIAPAVPRYVVETFEFQGYTIPKGTFVFFAICVPHFDPQYFADPFTFDPDRYLPPRNEALQANVYTPFGLGQHVCLSIGLIETVTMIATMGVLRNVELELHPRDYRMKVVASPMPGPANLKLRVTGKRQLTAPPKPQPDEVEHALSGLGLSGEELKRFASGVARRWFPSGTTIIRQGDAADAFYVVTEGDVEVLRERTDGGHDVLATIGPGGYFGEIGLLHGVPRTATVRVANGGAHVLEIGRELFLHMVAEHDLVSDDIAEMARRRVMSNQLADALPGIDRAAMAKVSGHLERRQFSPKDIVIRQGDPADRFYVIVSGSAEVVNHHPSGEDILLATLNSGDYFGEIGILQNRPRTATVRAVSDLEVLALEREHFLAMSDADHRTGTSIAEKAVERLLTSTA
jgi:CRP-like cAMP-binding protein/cytochrome P450